MPQLVSRRRASAVADSTRARNSRFRQVSFVILSLARQAAIPPPRYSVCHCRCVCCRCVGVGALPSEPLRKRRRNVVELHQVASEKTFQIIRKSTEGRPKIDEKTKKPSKSSENQPKNDPESKRIRHWNDFGAEARH